MPSPSTTLTCTSNVSPRIIINNNRINITNTIHTTNNTVINNNKHRFNINNNKNNIRIVTLCHVVLANIHNMIVLNVMACVNVCASVVTGVALNRVVVNMVGTIVGVVAVTGITAVDGCVNVVVCVVKVTGGVAKSANVVIGDVHNIVTNMQVTINDVVRVVSVVNVAVVSVIVHVVVVCVVA